MKDKILFLCTHNSSRSQMAEGLLRHMAGERYEVYSAGTEPGRVHPMAIQVMAEAGIDISGHRSKSMDEFPGETMDTVVTVCDGAAEVCPFFPGAKRMIHHRFPDPSRAPRDTMEEEFRRVRDMLGEWIQKAFVANTPEQQ